PVSCERLPWGRGYLLKIWPAVTGLQTRENPDMLQAVTRINQAIEAIVLTQPGQYLWGYARYKTPRKEAA
ncbi:MAG: lysophospholipid acyltransferase family protein, partial [Polaromonas sp.]